MARVLFTSGFDPSTLASARQQWEVLDIPEHRDALAHLRGCEELPDAVVIGYAVPPPTEDGTLPPEPSPVPVVVPAHEMLAQTLTLDANLPVIVSTGMAESNSIVYLIKQGAFDYVVEPPHPRDPASLERYTQRLLMAVSRAVAWRQVTLENRRLRQSATQNLPAIRGGSSGIRRVNELIKKVAPTPATVLVVGESGTGKELVARAIHEASDRASQPFLGLNCGAMDDTLLRSELFGHERGSFTGADAKHLGLIREAGHGTLFLDEIASISPTFQVAMLRVLEERTARPVGGQQNYPVQCRFVAASNRDLAELVATGQFREDLYYRLNVFQIRIPPLRERRRDIPTLAQHFLNRLESEVGRPDARFSHAAVEALERYDWPGNVRELRNVIERALILCEGSEIRPADLGIPGAGLSAVALDDQVDLRQELERLETQLIREALQRTGGNLAAAARLLKLKRPTLAYRIGQLGIR
jgi:DNA-binding NtrC family response regulator